MTNEQIEALFKRTENALICWGLDSYKGAHARHWHALRISSQGEIYTSQEVSPCYSEEEYFGRVPHSLTLHQMSGDNWLPNPDTGWLWNESEAGIWVGDFESPTHWADWGHLSDEERAARLARGWKRFDLDFENWMNDVPEADDVAFGWREKLQAWIDAGNFCPEGDE